MRKEGAITFIDILDFLKNYWVLILCVIGAILGWQSLENRMTLQEQRTQKIEEIQIKQNEEVLNEIKSMNTRLSTIEGFLKGKNLTLKQ